jgi:putative ABC transport system permease protein
MIRDLRVALRILLHKPGAAMLIVASLAAAIGLSTAAFSILDAYALRDLPVRVPRTLLWAQAATREQRPDNFSWTEYQAMASQARIFIGILAQDRESPRVKLPDRDDFPITTGVSDNYFDLLGVSAQRGDVFHTGVGADGEAVISQHYWEQAFGRDPHAVGRILGIGPGQVRIIGILPAGFAGVDRGLRTEIFVPTQTLFGTLQIARPNQTHDTRFEVLARLRSGVNLDRAQTEMNGVLRQVEREGDAPGPDRKAIVSAFTENGLGAKLETNSVFLAAMALLILIAGANLANLRLVENEARRRDTAIRMALGAGPMQLARQHFTETLILCGAGSAAGLLLAAWLLRAAPALLAGGKSYIDYGVRLDARTFAFAAASLIAVALIGALIPLSDAWKRRLADPMQGARTTGRSRWLGALVVAQMALVTCVACSAGVLWRSLQNVAAIRPAMDPGRNLLLLSGFWENLANPETRVAALAAHCGELPGIRSVAWARRALLSGSGGGAIVDVEVGGQPKYSFHYDQVSPGYFATTGARVLAGRTFLDSDVPAATPVAMVNAAFERRFFGIGKATGAWVKINGRQRQIVGVAEDGPTIHLRETIQPYLYFPFAQMPVSSVTWFIQPTGDTATLADSIRGSARRWDGEFTIGSMTTMHSFLRDARSSEELATDLTGSLAIAGLLLAAAGLFGVSLFAVTKRTREFGVRVAVGAAPASIARLVLKEAAIRVAFALPLGWMLSFASRHAMERLVYGIAPDDPWTLLAASAVVALAGTIAALHPALRAARTDPMAALRHD